MHVLSFLWGVHGSGVGWAWKERSSLHDSRLVVKEPLAPKQDCWSKKRKVSVLPGESYENQEGLTLLLQQRFIQPLLCTAHCADTGDT